MRHGHWTREHDCVLAERCEGLAVTQSTNGLGQVDYFTQMTLPSSFGHFGNTQPVVTVQSIPRYNTDIAACIRAAEGWRKQGPDRNYTTQSERDIPGFRVSPASASCLIGHARLVGSGEGPAALAQALYEAVTA